MRFVLILMLGCTLCSSVSAQHPPVSGDQDAVYRLDPQLDTNSVNLIRVAPEELKPGLTYNYYNPTLNRRAWGFAKPDGTFEYAFGEGTIVPTRRFDLRLSEAAQEKIVEQRVPRLKEAVEGLGRTPAVKLDASGNWDLLSYPSSARIFDVLTGQRWEWHGDRRVAVVNLHGNYWQVIEGKYEPLGLWVVGCR